jgi:hypothetical protein
MKSLVRGLCLCVLLTVSGRADAATITVGAGGDLQAAINAARPGDTILLQAGATFTGNFTLPAKGGSSYITIRSSASDSSLPPAGTRISPAYAGLLAKVRSTQNGPAFKTAAGATYWNLMFLEILPSVSTSAANLIELGAVGQAQNTLSVVPQHLVIDRCYIHGNPAYAQRRGIALNSGATHIVNSYIADIKGAGVDTQAIAGWNGPGPYLIENNHIEASGENILFGGGDPAVPYLVPSNIVIRRNLITKPASWVSLGYTLKNLIELKNAAEVLIEGNTIENNWAAGQQGYSLVFTPRNQTGTAPWSVVRDVTVQHNVIRHVAAVFNILGYDTNAASQQTSDIVVRNNLIYDVSTAYGTSGNPANGWFAVIGGGPKNITFDHNTVDNDGNDTVMFYTLASVPTQLIYGFVLTNNLLRDNAYGIFGQNSQEGNLTLNTFTPGAYVQGNAIGGADLQRYPVGNDYPTLAQWLADFAGRAVGNYQLLSTSLSKGSATDGTDIGVNFAALNAAMNAPVPAPAPEPTPTPPPPPAGPTPFSGTAAPLPGRIEAENYDKGGEGVAYHDTTAGNSTGAYRGDNVDIRPTTDSSGAFNLKSVRASEWLAYTVNVAGAGTYTIELRVASAGAGGTAHLEIDGSKVTGAIALPDTGGWNTWRTVTISGVSLPAGTHVLKLVIDANGSSGSAADINWIAVSAPAAPPVARSTPYTGTAIALPGRVEAENYDKGGAGLAYHDTTAGNSSSVYRSDDVDIRATTDSSGAYNLKSVRAGEWLAYSVNVASAGSYTVDLRVASSGTGGTVHLEIDGARVTSAIALPDTGGWNTWRTVTVPGVSLPAGAHVLKLVVDANGAAGTAADINWIAFR